MKHSTVRAVVFALLPLGVFAATPYQSMTVRNFVIDGPKLAAAHAKVKLIGTYILNGNIGVLYVDAQAVSMARYQPDAGRQPSVSLLTDGASHELRAALLSCDSNPVTGQAGCQIEIRGRAAMCDEVYEFGKRSAPCVNVEDGGQWYPPPPTPEQIQARKEAQEAERAEQARQDQAMREAMQEKYRECLNNTRIYVGTPMAYLIHAECGNPP